VRPAEPGSSPDPSEGSPTLVDLGEDALVDDIIGRYRSAPWLRVGPGDDAAVLDLAESFPGALVASTDTLVEGLDFRRDWSSGVDVGVKAAAQNFADIAAMGARPHTLLVSLTAPADLPAGWARDLAAGIEAECRRAGAVVAGGDLSGGTEISVTATALGSLGDRPAVLRSGARPGDVVAVAGVLGRSAAGLALLGAGPGSGLLGGLVADHRRPRPPYGAGPEAAGAGATAMIDTSDGLVRDAERLARASGVVLDLDPAALAPDADLVAAAAHLGEPDPAGWVLTGGEDHALLATFPPDAVLPPAFRPIGRVRPVPPGPDSAGPAGSGPAVTLAGRPMTGPSGWHHFHRS
jgi:thiamine-monophosphate kinase